MLRQTHGYCTSTTCPLSDKIRAINKISLPKFPVLIYKRFVANSVTIHRDRRNLATEDAYPTALLLPKILNSDCIVSYSTAMHRRRRCCARQTPAPETVRGRGLWHNRLPCNCARARWALRIATLTIASGGVDAATARVCL